MNDKPLSNPAAGIVGPAGSNLPMNRAARRAAWKATAPTEAEKRARLNGRGMSAARRAQALKNFEETRRNMAAQERDEIAAEAAYDVDTYQAAQDLGLGSSISQNIAQTMRQINEHWDQDMICDNSVRRPSQPPEWAERKERISRWLQNEVDWNEPDAAEKGFKITEIADRLGDALTLAGYHERPAEELDKIIGHSLDIMEDAIHLFFGVLP